ncbi:hypothetical protein J3Q64DRAFT_1453039 [Phycomyces blakesleeanus]
MALCSDDVAETGSFEKILRQQALDKMRKDRRPKKSLVRIQTEERAVEGLREFYVQTIEVESGEWFEVNRVGQ